jgi:hypothetical protein
MSYLLSNPGDVLTLLLQHLRMTGIALGIAIAARRSPGAAGLAPALARGARARQGWGCSTPSLVWR